MLSNNPLLLDNGGGSSCIQGILNTKLCETIDMVLSDLVNFDTDFSVCSPCLCVRVSKFKFEAFYAVSQIYIQEIESPCGVHLNDRSRNVWSEGSISSN